MFLRPFDIPKGATREMRLTLTRSDQGYAARIEGGHMQAGRQGRVTLAEADLRLLPLTSPAPRDIEIMRGRMENWQEAAGGPLPSPQEAHLDFGPRWRVLQARGLGTGEGLAHLRLPAEAQGDLAKGHLLHPALMDIATGWAMDLIEGYDGSDLWVPMSYGAVRVHAPLGQDVRSIARLTTDQAQKTGVARFDITLTDPVGRVLVEIEDFAIRKQAGGLAITPPRASEIRFDSAQDSAQDIAPAGPAEDRLRHNLREGIRPGEGAEAFRRALALGLPQVLVSSLDLPALIRQAEAGAQGPDEGGQRFERPDLDGDYVAPEGEIETRLAGFWSDLLGLDAVGVEDSFFDLGGHSLIAVRLFGMIRKAYRVDFPISILFEAPTIRACARLIEDRIGPQEAGESAPAKTQPARRFTHLVPMHRGEGGAKTPFFLVAGMFGNVLNLRHLAHLLGDDRPFFGLQARGLYGDDAPHDDLTEAARDMIAEIRQVQPHGPYLLGGFSGGGITAYEMAQQLEGAGEKVGLVILLDTPLPQRRPLSRRDRALIQWQEFKSNGPLYPVKWAARRVAWEIARRRPQAQAETAEHQFHDHAIEAAFYRAIARYQVRPWSGRLQLFRPPQSGKWRVSNGQWVSSERAYVLPDNDWSGFAPNLSVTEVPGTHDSMVLEPNVRVLAARMRRVIEAAEGTQDAPPDIREAAE
jgi:thioesterase domain-containing protein/acyl carrier protein